MLNYIRSLDLMMNLQMKAVSPCIILTTTKEGRKDGENTQDQNP